MRLPFVLPAILLAACASSRGGPATKVVTDGVVYSGEVSVMGVEVVRTREVMDAEVDQSFDEVWRVIPTVLSKLQMAVEQADAKAGTVTTRSMRFRGSLDGSRLSTYFECGQSSMGKTADRYSVIVKVSTSVRSAGEGRSILSNLVSATAKPDDGGVSVPCDSNGNLEKRIRNRVVAEFVSR